MNIYDKSCLKTLINKHLKKVLASNNFSFPLYPLVDTISILFKYKNMFNRNYNFNFERNCITICLYIEYFVYLYPTE